jgi:hypothetical protein
VNGVCKFNAIFCCTHHNGMCFMKLAI